MPIIYGQIPGQTQVGFRNTQTPTPAAAGGTGWGNWVLPAAISTAGSLLGAWITSRGQDRANQTNARIAREQMDFQERMSNTAHQREVADYKAAGLNPALGYHSGGSSSPTGSSAKMENTLAAYGGSAAAAAQAFQAIAATKTNIDATEAQTERTRAETTQLQMESAARLEQMQGLGRSASSNARFLEATYYPRKSMAESEAFTAAATRLGKEQEVSNIKELFPLQLEQLREQIRGTIQSTRDTAAHARLAELAEPTARNLAAAANTAWGQKVSPFLHDAQSALDLFQNLLYRGRRR